MCVLVRTRVYTPPRKDGSAPPRGETFIRARALGAARSRLARVVRQKFKLGFFAKCFPSPEERLARNRAGLDGYRSYTWLPEEPTLQSMVIEPAACLSSGKRHGQILGGGLTLPLFLSSEILLPGTLRNAFDRGRHRARWHSSPPYGLVASLIIVLLANRATVKSFALPAPEASNDPLSDFAVCSSSSFFPRRDKERKRMKSRLPDRE